MGIPDRTPMRELVAENYQWMRSYARKLTGNRSDADDLANECVIRIITHADQFTPGTNFKAWATTIMYHAYMSWYRVRKRLVSFDMIPESLRVSNGKEAEWHIAFLEACEYLDMCPEEHQEALYDYALGLTYKEMAAKHDVVVGTTKSRVSRARSGLCELMGEEYQGLSTVEVL